MLDLLFIIGLKTTSNEVSYHPTQRTVPIASMYNYLKDKLRVKVYIAEFFNNYDSLPEARNYAISFFSHEISYAQELTKFLRAKDPNSIIFAGGMGVTANRGALLEDIPELDFFIAGDGLDPMIDIFLKGISYKDHPCTTYKGHEGIRSSLSLIPSSNLIYDEDAFVPWDKEAIGKKKSNYAAALLCASQGCPFQCYFCGNAEIYGQKAQYRDVEVLKQDVKRLLQDPLTQGIYFTDAICNVPDPKRLESFRAVFQTAVDSGFNHEKHIFHLMCRPQYITREKDKFRELLEEFGDRLSYNLFFGIENFDQRGLDALGKLEKAEDYYRIFDNLKYTPGVTQVASTIIFGFPGDSDEILQTNIDYTLRLVKRYREAESKINININAVPLQIFPYTHFYEHRFDWPQHFTGVPSNAKNDDLLQENEGLTSEWFLETVKRVKKFNKDTGVYTCSEHQPII